MSVSLRETPHISPGGLDCTHINWKRMRERSKALDDSERSIRESMVATDYLAEYLAGRRECEEKKRPVLACYDSRARFESAAEGPVSESEQAPRRDKM
jgi:hypothetical protein